MNIVTPIGRWVKSRRDIVEGWPGSYEYHVVPAEIWFYCVSKLQHQYIGRYKGKCFVFVPKDIYWEYLTDDA